MHSTRNVAVRLVREWIGSGERLWLPVTGHSMRPFLSDGSRLLLSRLDGRRVRPGDLVLYEAEDGAVCHRALTWRVRWHGREVLTKGDSAETHAAWVSEAQLVGRVVAVERAGAVVRLDTARQRLRAIAAATRGLIAAWSKRARSR